jgi:hypothetical protein
MFFDYGQKYLCMYTMPCLEVYFQIGYICAVSALTWLMRAI